MRHGTGAEVESFTSWYPGSSQRERESLSLAWAFKTSSQRHISSKNVTPTPTRTYLLILLLQYHSLVTKNLNILVYEGCSHPMYNIPSPLPHKPYYNAKHINSNFRSLFCILQPQHSLKSKAQHTFQDSRQSNCNAWRIKSKKQITYFHYTVARNICYFPTGREGA